MNDINYFAKTNARNKFIPFGIKENDRFSHTYIIGKTGVGKTTLLKTKILQDIQHGKGFAVFDPHGDLADWVISEIPHTRQTDLVHFNIPNPSCTLRYNPLKKVSREKRPLVASGLLEALKRYFGTLSWGVRMEHILRNCLLTLLDQPTADLADILHLIHDKRFREGCFANISNESVKDFWVAEYAKYPPFTRQAAIAPIQNKVGAFLSNPITKRILIENEHDISFRHAMDNKKIVIVNLAKGKIGDDAASLLGALFITSMGLSAFSRQDEPEHSREPFFIYCDEFQSFTTTFLVNALSELRKYRVGLILANQYLKQIDSEIREAVLGNVGTLIVFRVGYADAVYFSKDFNDKLKPRDFTHLANFDMYLRLMIEGRSSDGFSAMINTHHIQLRR